MSNEADRIRRGWIGLRRLPAESDLRAVLVSLIVCLFCSAAISLVVAWVGPYRESNRALARRQQVEQIVASAPGLSELVDAGKALQLEVQLVDLESGRFVRGIDPDAFDPATAARDPDASVEIPAEADIAGLGRRARWARVYRLLDEGELSLLVLPVEGMGYVSILRGYLALEPDLRTIRALRFYEHSETPGLGSEIDNPEWLAQWVGKRAFDAEGKPRIAVDRGRVDPDAPDAIFKVDGLSGATRTGAGVTQLLRFWLGPHGYGPLLSQLSEQATASGREESR